MTHYEKCLFLIKEINVTFKEASLLLKKANNNPIKALDLYER